MPDEGTVFIPSGWREIELEEKRSRFIARAEPLSDPGAAKGIIAERRLAHPAASHVVWAFITGGPSSRTGGMSDDGEPKGTAGRPVMEVLKGSGICNIILTVTRYFGGTKLGTGGLVRAYSDSAKKVLEQLPVRALVQRIPFSVRLPYELYEQAKRLFSDVDAEISSEEFGTDIGITGEIPSGLVSACSETLRNMSAGRVELIVPPPASD